MRFAILVVLALSAPAYAQKPDADAAFERGRKLMAKGETAKACEEFEASMRFDPQKGTLYNLALCHEKLGKLATAWTEFKELAATDPNPARAKDSGKHAAALEPRLTHMRLTVHQAPGLVVERDGKDVTSLVGAESAVDPGKYTFVARAPGREPVTIAAELGGEGKTVDVELPELRATSEPAPAAPAEEYSTRLPLRPLALPLGMVEPTGTTTLYTGNQFKNADPVNLMVGVRAGLGRVEAEAAMDFHVVYNETVEKPSEPATFFLAGRYIATPMFTLGLEYTNLQPRGGGVSGFATRVVAARKYLVADKVGLIARGGLEYTSVKIPCEHPTATNALGEGDIQLAASARVSFQLAALLAIHTGDYGSYYKTTLGLVFVGTALYVINPRLDVTANAYFPAQPSDDPQVYSIALAWRTR